MNEMNNRLWSAAHRLAAELAQRNFDVNLLKNSAEYMQKYPDADFHDWLSRLIRLGEMHASSNQTPLYRYELQQACQRLRPQPTTGSQWALILAWAARLFTYYKEHRTAARQISDVGRLPIRPQSYHDFFVPPPPEKTERANDLPEVREEVSDAALEFMKMFQAAPKQPKKKRRR